MGTLSERIKAAEQRQNIRPLRPAEPVEFRPRWLERLQAKDTTDLVLGAWIGPKDRGAA